MARNPVQIAEALRRLNALEGGKLPTIESGGAVTPVMIVQDLTKSLAVEPFQVSGAVGVLVSSLNPNNDLGVWLQPIGGSGLVVTRIRLHIYTLQATTIVPKLFVSHRIPIDPAATNETAGIYPTGGGPPVAQVHGGAIDVPLALETTQLPNVWQDLKVGSLSAWQGLIDIPVSWLVPAGAAMCIGCRKGDPGVTWYAVAYCEWREVPDT